jgi:hypothetical protein
MSTKHPLTREQLQAELTQIRAQTMQVAKLVTDLRNQQARVQRALLELSSPPQRASVKT